MKYYFQVNLIKGTEGTEDITEYYVSGASFTQTKQLGIDEIEASDVTLSFSNHNNFFSESSGGVFYNKEYLNKWYIEFKAGTENNNLITQFIGLIKNVSWNYEDSSIEIYCQDTISNLIDTNINTLPYWLMIQKGTSNVGNGDLTGLQLKPFSTKTETFNITFTDGTSFQVVGSVSGNVGTGVVGQEFIASGSQCKFTIQQGNTPFQAGDSFVIYTFQFPEFFEENPMKVIWSILTGYDYDTDTQTYYYDRILHFDHTKGTENKDIDYESFLDVLNKTEKFKITGFIPINKNAKELLQEIISTFLGSVWIQNSKIYFNFKEPNLGETNIKVFNDDNILNLSSSKNLEDIYNEILIKTKMVFDENQAKEIFVFTDKQGNQDTDKLNCILNYIDEESINKYDIKRTYEQTLYHLADDPLYSWVSYKTTHLLDMIRDNVQIINFQTYDAFDLKIGDIIRIESNTANLNGFYEIFEIQKDFSQIPFIYTITARNDLISTTRWAFLASLQDEGDGISPQTEYYDYARDIDKYFCYLSDGTNEPKYYSW